MRPGPAEPLCWVTPSLSLTVHGQRRNSSQPTFRLPDWPLPTPSCTPKKKRSTLGNPDMAAGDVWMAALQGQPSKGLPSTGPGQYLVHQAPVAAPPCPAARNWLLFRTAVTGALASPGPLHPFQTRQHTCNAVGWQILFDLVHQVPSPRRAGRLLDTAALHGSGHHAGWHHRLVCLDWTGFRV